MISRGSPESWPKKLKSIYIVIRKLEPALVWEWGRLGADKAPKLQSSGTSAAYDHDVSGIRNQPPEPLSLWCSDTDRQCQ